MATEKNLTDAFAGESQANRKYLAFAKKAETEGRPQIAKLFRAAAAAETVHAHAHLRVLKGVGATKDNIESAVAGEGFEFREMYPKYLAEAGAEGARQAEISFRNALAVEGIHLGLFLGALEAQEAGKDLPAGPIFVCDICGNTVIGAAPDVCPVCGAGKGHFAEVA